jgi:death-on-curing protein
MAQMGQEIFQTLYGKAANLMHLIITGQPFHDGNKRAGFGAAVVFLAINGQDFGATDHEILDFCRAVERGSLQPDVMAEWLKSRSVPRI